MGVTFEETVYLRMKKNISERTTTSNSNKYKIKEGDKADNRNRSKGNFMSQNIQRNNNENDEREEGEIVDEFEDIISSDEEISMIKRIEELEARNAELEKIANISGVYDYDLGYTNDRYQKVDLNSYNNHDNYTDEYHYSLYHAPKRVSAPKKSSSKALLVGSPSPSPTRLVNVEKESKHYHRHRHRRKAVDYDYNHDGDYRSPSPEAIPLKSSLVRTRTKCRKRKYQKTSRSRDRKKNEKRKKKTHYIAVTSSSEDDECILNREELKIALQRDVTVPKSSNLQKGLKITIDKREDFNDKTYRVIDLVSPDILDTSIDGTNDKENEKKNVNEESDDSTSLEEQELRLIALKSAVLKNHLARRRRRHSDDLKKPYSPSDFVEIYDICSKDMYLQSPPSKTMYDGGDTGSYNNSMDISPISSPEIMCDDCVLKPVDMEIVTSNSSPSPLMFEHQYQQHQMQEYHNQNMNSWIPIDQNMLINNDATFDNRQYQQHPIRTASVVENVSVSSPPLFPSLQNTSAVDDNEKVVIRQSSTPVDNESTDEEESALRALLLAKMNPVLQITDNCNVNDDDDGNNKNHQENVNNKNNDCISRINSNENNPPIIDHDNDNSIESDKHVPELMSPSITKYESYPNEYCNADTPPIDIAALRDFLLMTIKSETASKTEFVLKEAVKRLKNKTATTIAVAAQNECSNKIDVDDNRTESDNTISSQLLELQQQDENVCNDIITENSNILNNNDSFDHSTKIIPEQENNVTISVNDDIFEKCTSNNNSNNFEIEDKKYSLENDSLNNNSEIIEVCNNDGTVNANTNLNESVLVDDENLNILKSEKIKSCIQEEITNNEVNNQSSSVNVDESIITEEKEHENSHILPIIENLSLPSSSSKLLMNNQIKSNEDSDTITSNKKLTKNRLKAANNNNDTQLVKRKVIKGIKTSQDVVSSLAKEVKTKIISKKYAKFTSATSAKKPILLPFTSQSTSTTTTPTKSTATKFITKLDVPKIERFVINLGESESESDYYEEENKDTNMDYDLNKEVENINSNYYCDDIASPMSLPMDSPIYSPVPTSSTTVIVPESSSSSSTSFTNVTSKELSGTEKHVVNDIFQAKLDEYLKNARTKVDQIKKDNFSTITETTGRIIKTISTKQPTAVCHLPKSSQLEYRRLINRMKILEKQKQARKTEIDSRRESLKVTIQNDQAISAEASDATVDKSNETEIFPSRENIQKTIINDLSTEMNNVLANLNEINQKDKLVKKVLIQNASNSSHMTENEMQTSVVEINPEVITPEVIIPEKEYETVDKEIILSKLNKKGIDINEIKDEKKPQQEQIINLETVAEKSISKENNIDKSIQANGDVGKEVNSTLSVMTKSLKGNKRKRSVSTDNVNINCTSLNDGKEKFELLKTYKNEINEKSFNLLQNIERATDLVLIAQKEKLNKFLLEEKLDELKRQTKIVENELCNRNKKLSIIYPDLSNTHKAILALKVKYNNLDKSALELGKTLHGSNYGLKNDVKECILHRSKKLSIEIKKLKNLNRSNLEQNVALKWIISAKNKTQIEKKNQDNELNIKLKTDSKLKKIEHNNSENYNMNNSDCNLEEKVQKNPLLLLPSTNLNANVIASEKSNNTLHGNVENFKSSEDVKATENETLTVTENDAGCVGQMMNSNNESSELKLLSKCRTNEEVAEISQSHSMTQEINELNESQISLKNNDSDSNCTEKNHYPDNVDKSDMSTPTITKTPSNNNILVSNIEVCSEVANDKISNTTFVSSAELLMGNKNVDNKQEQFVNKENVENSLSHESMIGRSQLMEDTEKEQATIKSDIENTAGKNEIIGNKQLPFVEVEAMKAYESPLSHMYQDRRTIDPNGIICPYQLMGQCDDKECKFIHL